MEKPDLRGIKPVDRVIGLGNAAVATVFLRKGAKLGPATWVMAEGKPEIQLILLNKLLEDGNTLYRKNKLLDAATDTAMRSRDFPVISLAGRRHSHSWRFLSS